MTVTNPFTSLFPQNLDIIPYDNETAQGWVETDFGLFNTQWISCSYPISGGYGRAPRFLYYILIAFALIQRRKTWIAGAALALVMGYSGVTAIHALALVAIRRDLVPQYMIDNYEVVLVGGSTQNGSWVWPTEDTWPDTGLWLPLLPGAWDSDCDAILAIIGVAFLVLAPMQNWSVTFRASRKKTILLLWGILLLAGMIAALFNEAQITFYSFPQLRFCPLGLNDTLPLANAAPNSIGGEWDRINRYRWNETLTNFFEGHGSPDNPTACVYPCFDSSWRVRDPTDIVAAEIPSLPDANGLFWLFFFVYVLFSAATISSFTICAMHCWKPLVILRSKTFSEFSDKCKAAWHYRPLLRLAKLRLMAKVALDALLHAVDFWAKILSLVVIILFIVWIERTMALYDQQGETMRHVGQWGPLIGAALAFIAAIVDQYYRGERPKAPPDIETPMIERRNSI